MLPTPTADALAHSQHLQTLLISQIEAAGGWISFADFMSQALYAPGLGYYAAGARKFGAAGDFVTAPEMTPLFGQALARQVAQIMQLSSPVVLEVGAGSGRLAADILLALEAMGQLPDNYAILDLSPDLRERQRQTLKDAAPHLLSRVHWLESLPATFSGVVLANELLDALPAHLVRWDGEAIFERGVGLDANGAFIWCDRPATGALRLAAEDIAQECVLPPDYLSEISLAARAWSAEWAHRLQQGAVLLLDYGFPRHEFYHPQRRQGTLMCHYRHHAHPDPFYLPGLQDITVHVDFTAIIAAAHPAGLDLLGYTNQGRFLMNCGLLDLLAGMPAGTADYFRASAAVGKLTMPHEMGELFKVMALGKGIEDSLLGFALGDQSRRL